MAVIEDFYFETMEEDEDDDDIIHHSKKKIKIPNVFYAVVGFFFGKFIRDIVKL